MTSTRIEWSFNKIARMADLADLAEMLFPGNRNHQYTFLLVWITLKWTDHRIVPNFDDIARQHGVSRRTLERVRAKMRRMGLIDHVSRFKAKHGYREGWVFSPRFERSLKQLAEKVGQFKEPALAQQEKDMLLLDLLGSARQAVIKQKLVTQSESSLEVIEHE